MNKTLKDVGGIVLFAALMLGVAYGLARNQYTRSSERDMRNVAYQVLDNPLSINPGPYHIEYNIVGNKDYRYVKVTSGGWDEKWDTWDDLSVEIRDYNKSKMVGEFLGKRLKEAGKGFVDGISGKSDFNKNQ